MIPRYFRPAEVDLLIGDASKAKKILGWQPKTTFAELVRIMVQADDDPGDATQRQERPELNDEAQDAIFVAGHRGMVGAALVRLLQRPGLHESTAAHPRGTRPCDADAVRAFYEKFRPDYVLVAAAKVGGILANATQPVEFLATICRSNSTSSTAPMPPGVKKLLFLGSSCIYPKLAPQPITENSLLTGSLEPTNEAYALAKICGIKLCQAYAKQYGANFISAMPTNLYGPEDNFDLKTSHVLPALIHRFHLAKETAQPSVTLWGTGGRVPRIPARRRPGAGVPLPHGELRFAGIRSTSACGHDITIRDLAGLVGQVVGYFGQIEWDTTKPDGTPKKLLDVSKLNQLGWKAIPLEDGIRSAYQWFVENQLR